MTGCNNYHTTIKFLYDLQLFGIKVGLKNIKTILNFLGNPQNNFPSIHIAGTNGKGSIASMIASILTASGYRTGLYTSPHLIDFSERIRIDGRAIPIDRIIYYTKLLKREIESTKATFFEATTAIAFKYFADEKVDIAVIETGLGGRWDATNVLIPLLSIITNIEIEHTQYLGNTYDKIAKEKGGIIKKGIPCLTGTTNRSAMQRLKNICHLKKSSLIDVNKVTSYRSHYTSLNGSNLDVRVNDAEYHNIKLWLAGEHQMKNLCLVLYAINYLKNQCAFNNIKIKGVYEGLSHISRYSGLQGRIQIISKSPLIIADVAHNPNGIFTLVNALKKLIVGKVITIFGVMSDKDYISMISILKQITRCMISVQLLISRALKEGKILEESHKQLIKTIRGGSIENGLKRAINETSGNEPILLTGSHYVVGEALKHYKNTCFL